MSKYHFYFEDRLGKKILEYDTDVEPPNMGDTVRFGIFAGNMDEDAIYVVYDRWYSPDNENHVNYLFTLDLRE